MQRILYLMQKEFRQIFRDKANLVIIFIMPFIQLVLLGFAITMDVKNIRMTVVDQDHSIMSRQIISAYSYNNTFRFQGLAGSVKQAIKWLDLGQVKLIVVVPQKFTKDLKNGRVPSIQTIYDGVDGNSAGITNGYVTKIMQSLQTQWLPEISKVKLKRLHIVNLEPRMLYNPELVSTNNIVPGIISLLLTMVTLFLTTVNIVREKEIGTLEQLSVTPIKNQELIIGKILPFAILGFLLFNVGLLAAGLIFNIWLKGSLLLLYLACFIYMLTTLGLGIFLSTVSASQQQAMFYAWFISLFSIMLSGFFVPIENMPDVIRLMTYLNPTRYFMEIVRGIILKASGLNALWPELLAMLVFGSVIITSAVASFHKRLK